MAERDTILSRGPTSAGPIQGPNVRPPAGSFGVYEGLSDLGRGLQNAGETGASVAARYYDRVRQESDSRDANDIQARFQLALNEESTGLQQDYIKSVESGLAHEPLLNAVSTSAQARMKNIDDRLADMRTRNPRIFDRIVTKETKAAAWSARVDNVTGAAIQHSAQVSQGERWETAVKNDDFEFANVAGNPGGVLAVADKVLADIDAKKNLFTAEQRMRRKNAVEQRVSQTIIASAQITGDKGLEPIARNARDRGLMTPGQYAAVVADIARLNDPTIQKGELRATADAMNKRVKGGDHKVDPVQVQEALSNAMVTYQTPDERFNQVIKPHVLSFMEGKLRSAAGHGFLVANDYRSANRILSELAKPESAEIAALFEQQFGDAKVQAFTTYPAMQADMKATWDMKPSAEDYASYRSALQATLQKQTEMVDNFRSYALYKDNPGVAQAIAQGDMVALERVQRQLYARDGIPEDKQIIAVPDELDAIRERLNLVDEASVGQTAKMIDDMVRKFGSSGYGALISLSQAPGPVAGIVRFQAQRFNVLNKDAEAGIGIMLPELIQAVSWSGSKAAKDIKDKDPNFDRDNSLYWNRAFAYGYPGDESVAYQYRNAASSFRKLVSDDFSVNPSTSPLGQASTREGSYDAIHSLGKALTDYYRQGTKNTAPMHPAEAAKKAREVLSRAFIPVKANGGGAEQPIYTFAPVTKKETSWYTSGSRGAFNSQRHYAQMEAAAWDSMFLANQPKFGLGGKIQWSLDSALADLFNGPKMGIDIEFGQMPNLDTAFYGQVFADLRTTAYNKNPIDFANVGIETVNNKGEKQFMPLSEDRIVTDYLPVTVRERVAGLLKKLDPTDYAGRAQLILANNFQREPNPKTQSWDVYLTSGRDYDGTAGTVSKAGPRASVVVRQADGTWKKLAISFVEADNRLEAFMGRSSFTNRPGSGANSFFKNVVSNNPN